MKIRFKKLNHNAVVPKKATSGAAAYDLYTSEGRFIKPKERVIIPTGIALEIPEGYMATIRPRSGFSAKGMEGYLVVGNKVLTEDKVRFNADVRIGTIDSDYRDGVGIIVSSSESHEYFIPAGTRIAQLVIQKYEDVEFEETENLSDTERGKGGFGSTGTN